MSENVHFETKYFEFCHKNLLFFQTFASQVVALVLFIVVCGTESERAGKILPIFQIVRFPNDPCDANASGKNGTCYTA